MSFLTWSNYLLYWLQAQLVLVTKNTFICTTVLHCVTFMTNSVKQLLFVHHYLPNRVILFNLGQILFSISKNIITDLNCICCNFLTSILISNGLTPLSSLDQGASIFHKNYGLLNQPLSDLLWIKPKRSTIDKILLAWHIAPMINICVFLDLIHVVSNKHFESLLIASNLW